MVKVTVNFLETWHCGVVGVLVHTQAAQLVQSVSALSQPCPARTTTEEVTLPILKAKDNITPLRVSIALLNAYHEF